MHNIIDILSSLVSIKCKMFNSGPKQLEQASFKTENACTVFWNLQTVHKFCRSLIWRLVYDDFMYKNHDFLNVLACVKNLHLAKHLGCIQYLLREVVTFIIIIFWYILWFMAKYSQVLKFHFIIPVTDADARNTRLK